MDYIKLKPCPFCGSRPDVGIRGLIVYWDSRLIGEPGPDITVKVVCKTCNIGFAKEVSVEDGRSSVSLSSVLETVSDLQEIWNERVVGERWSTWA